MAGGAGDGFGALLRRHRLLAGLTQEGLAERAGISARAVSDLERGGGRAPRLETVGLLAEALGLTGEQRVALLAARRAAPGTPPATPLPPVIAPEPPPLFGRERERARLREHLDAALAGRGGLVLIGGEAGIGKSALAEMLAYEAAREGALALTGRCYDLTETPPYGPWIELFARYRQTDGAPPLPAAFAARGTVGAVPSQMALFQQALDFFAAITAVRPLVLLLDDIHWADPASLDLLRFLARHVATRPLLLVVAYRTEEVTRRHSLYQLLPLLEHEAPAARLDLRRLPEAAVRAHVAARYALAEGDTARLTAHLDARAGGNALFTVQLLRALEEEGVLDAADGCWTLGDLAGVPVPTALRQVIATRLARLGAEAEALLAVGAVIGQEVPLGIWATVAETDEDALLDLVQSAVAAHLMAETADGTNARFVHALIREALYEGMPPARRRHVHRRVGETLAALPQADPDAVAHHFQRAGDARAAEWLIRAGDRAQRLYAWLTAADRLEAALAAMERQGEGNGKRAQLLVRLAALRRFVEPGAGLPLLDEAERLAAAAGDRALVGICRWERGRLLAFDGQQEAAITAMAAGVAAIEALPASGGAESVPGWMRYDGAVVASPRGTFLVWLAVLGRFGEAVAMAERFADETVVPSGAGADEYYADGLWGLGRAYHALGRPVEARAALLRTLTFFAKMEHHFVWGSTAKSLLLVVLAYETERIEERRALAATAEEQYRKAGGAIQDFSPRLGQLPLLLVEGAWAEAREALEQGAARTKDAWQLREGFGTLLRAQGETARAWERVRAELPEGTATRPGTRLFGVAVETQRLAASLALDTGDLATAKGWIEMHDRWLAWSGAALWRSEGAALWAHYHRQAGDTERAYEHAQRALVHATEPRQPLALLAAHRLLGELDTEARRFDGAACHLDASLTLATACAVPYERALTLLARARLHAARCDTAAALIPLDDARALALALGATPLLAQLDALAAALAPPPAPAFPDGLTTREVEVLCRIAAGMSNQRIGDDLCLSVRTVERHMTNLYRKINAHSKAQATAYALRRGLA